MKLPANYEKCLSILILRTLNLNQDEVASMIKCGKSTVVEVEQWVKRCLLDEATSLCDDQAIQGLVDREFPWLEEISEDILVKAGKVHGEDILRHYREDFIVKQSVEDPLIQEMREKHTLELRDILTQWMNQLANPSILPYALRIWLTEEMPREWIYEISEHHYTTKLFEDILENTEDIQSTTREHHLEVESHPKFDQLLAHLSGHSIVTDLENLKVRSHNLARDYGILIGEMIQIISTTEFRQRYKEQMSTLSKYDEIVSIVKDSKIKFRVIGTTLSYDLFIHATRESSSESFRIAFAKALRETRAWMVIALNYMGHDSVKISSELAYLAMLLWGDRDDPIQVQTRVQELLKRTEQLQQFYDDVQTPFQLLLNEYTFPGRCSSCPD